MAAPASATLVYSTLGLLCPLRDIDKPDRTGGPYRPSTHIIVRKRVCGNVPHNVLL